MHRRKRIAVAAIGHLVATCVCFTLFVSLFMTEQVLGLLEVGVVDPQLQLDVFTSLGIIFGLAACAWGMFCIVVALARLNLQKDPKKHMKKARGTIITETLIVLPIFFLLTFGLSQMALNSIGGLLTTLASYEVARSLAVWAPEEGNRASRGQIETKARLVAAGVIAPAVPDLQSGLCNAGSVVEAMREGMTGTGLNANVGGDLSKASFAEGWSTRTFADRGPTKLTAGFCNVEVSWDGPNSTSTDSTRTSPVTARVRYHHPVTMPLVGPIFTNNYGAGTWITDYVSTYDKSYMLYSYLTPNIYRPYQDPNLPWHGVP